MCSFAAAGLAFTALSTVLGVVGQSQQAAQQQAMASAQAKAQRLSAEYNAKVAEQQAAAQRTLAQNEIAKGVADRERQTRDAARKMGELRAQMGTSGFQMDTGTFSSLLDESAQEAQYDANIITQNANMAAWQHLASANQADNNAAGSSWQGAAVQTPDYSLSPWAVGGSLRGGSGRA